MTPRAQVMTPLPHMLGTRWFRGSRPGSPGIDTDPRSDTDRPSDSSAALSMARRPVRPYSRDKSTPRGHACRDAEADKGATNEQGTGTGRHAQGRVRSDG